MRLLLVEDEPQLAVAIRAALEHEGCHVIVERSGEGGFFRAVTESFDLIVIDTTLPGRDGQEILGALRNEGIAAPVLVMIGAGSGAASVGADGVLVKPFTTGELIGCVRALLSGGRIEPPARDPAQSSRTGAEGV